MTSSLVFDASAALAWIIPNQATEASARFRDTIPRNLIAPSHFRLEIRHAILRLERRGAIVARSLDGALVEIDALVEVIDDPGLYPVGLTFELGRMHNLGIYDALYLMLAIRAAATLASRYGPLLAAARKAGVEVFDLR